MRQTWMKGRRRTEQQICLQSLISAENAIKKHEENESEDNLKNEMEYIKRNERKFWAFQMS